MGRDLKKNAPGNHSPAKKESKPKHKHHALWTLLGATIILVTFLGRDYLLDQFRDARDDAASQVQLLQVRTDIYDLRFEMKRAGNVPITETFLKKSQYYAGFVPTNAMKASDFDLFNGLFLDEGAPNIADEQDDVVEIIELLRKSDDGCAELLKRKLLIYKTITQDEWKQTSSSVHQHPKDPFPFIMKYVSDTYDRQQAMDKTIYLIKNYVISELEASAAKAERWYDIFNYSSVVLFIVGWVITLVAQLKGINLGTD